jgi:hypothetical protein
MPTANETATAKVNAFLEDWDPVNFWDPAKAAFVLDLVDRKVITIGAR